MFVWCLGAFGFVVCLVATQRFLGSTILCFILLTGFFVDCGVSFVSSMWSEIRVYKFQSKRGPFL